MNDLLEKAALSSEYATSIAINVMVGQVWAGIAAGLPSQIANDEPPQVLFIVPWRDKSMIGTWHIPWTGGPESFRIHERVIEEFIDRINSAHPALDLSLGEIDHITWGFLPVSKGEAGREPVRLARDGVVIDHQSGKGVAGLITILGVKYTTARAVAERAVDLAVQKLGLRATKCRTHLTPVTGGHVGDFRDFLKRALGETPVGVDESLVEHLVYTYGSEYRKFLQHITKQPELADRVDPHLPVTMAEILHAVRHEMALTLADVVQRRTELGAAGLPSMEALQKCAGLMAVELGWTLERRQQEIDSVVRAYPIHKLDQVVV